MGPASAFFDEEPANGPEHEPCDRVASHPSSPFPRAPHREHTGRAELVRLHGCGLHDGRRVAGSSGAAGRRGRAFGGTPIFEVARLTAIPSRAQKDAPIRENRLMGFRLANVDGRAALVSGGDYYDLEAVSGGRIASDPMAALAACDQLPEITAGLGAQTPTGQLADAKLGPPSPRPANSFGIGLNYRNHAEEGGMPIPDAPLVFAKFPSCIAGPDDDVLNSKRLRRLRGRTRRRDRQDREGRPGRGRLGPRRWALRRTGHLRPAQAIQLGPTPVQSGQVVRHLRTDRTGADLAGRAREPRRHGAHLRGERRGSPEGQHRRPDLRRADARRLPLGHHDAASRRRDLHRDARRGRRVPEQAAEGRGRDHDDDRRSRDDHEHDACARAITRARTSFRNR